MANDQSDEIGGACYRIEMRMMCLSENLKRPFEIWNDTIKMGLKEIGLGVCELYLCSWGWSQISGSCELCNEQSSSIEDGYFL
jgi:hypothetical protein